MEPLRCVSPAQICAVIIEEKDDILLALSRDSLIEWLPENETLNSDYYIRSLEKLRETIKKRHGKLIQSLFLQHDNTRPHTSRVTNAAIARLGFKVMEHPPYAPYLAPSDYWLLARLKKSHCGRTFALFSQLHSAANS
uniref:Transposase n=1 Tax=Plectus sambesii TaxID=2011161 RepID=A0A914X4G9_9BILA